MMPGHNRKGDADGCEIEHHRLKDRVRQEFKEEMKTEIDENGRSIVRIVSLRLGAWLTFLVGSSLAVLISGGNWISHAQVEHHENREHKALVTDEKMDIEHKIIEERLSDDIEDLHDQVQDINETVSDIKQKQHENYITILQEIRKIPTGTPEGP